MALTAEEPIKVRLRLNTDWTFLPISDARLILMTKCSLGQHVVRHRIKGFRAKPTRGRLQAGFFRSQVRCLVVGQSQFSLIADTLIPSLDLLEKTMNKLRKVNKWFTTMPVASTECR